ncbi:hypothetical protein RIF29_28448 [Crotalaria pallida]|uniref:Uncharacterized protein n=1 Tax=Crotalaria pallida TaxID=3830 RepID=A0AAN9EF19_CROPI
MLVQSTETNPLLAFVTKGDGKSERSSVQEDDLKERSMNKVKMDNLVETERTTMEEDPLEVTDVSAKRPKASYAASLMHSIGDNSQGGFIDTDDDLPENKWYRQEEEKVNDDDFDPCLEIEWCPEPKVNNCDQVNEEAIIVPLSTTSVVAAEADTVADMVAKETTTTDA